VGSGQHRAVVRVLDDGQRFARVRFETTLPLAPGDHFVLRSSARQTTIGGAQVLDVSPARRVADAVARLGLPLPERVLAARPWLPVDEIAALTGSDERSAATIVDDLVARNVAVIADGWVVATDELERVVRGATERVARHHRSRPAEAGAEIGALARALGVDRGQLRAAIATTPTLVAEREIVRHVEHRGGAEHADGRRLREALEASPFAPPAAADLGIDAAVAKALVRDGAAVDLDGVLFATSAVDSARRLVSDALRARGECTIAEIRDVLGSTRKFVVPLVNRLDAEGVTRRRGDVRIAGPKAF
ncbi:MAG: selenocysteine-specific elongation factor, partial [Actinomycetota bacterium]|nr:selenocysteine-specific elongation factor [Actinomycetota bacterium]